MDTNRRRPVTPKQAHRDRAYAAVAGARARLSRMYYKRLEPTRKPLDLAHQVGVLLDALNEWDRACQAVGA